MKMKTKGSLSFIAVAVIVTALSVLAGCAPAEGDSIQDIIEKFIGGINEGNEETIRECLDPDAEQDDKAVVMSFWSVVFPGNDYKIDRLVEIGDTATVNFTGGVVDVLLYFKMTDEGDTYTINEIRVATSTGERIFY